jgi:hypothetical protein
MVENMEPLYRHCENLRRSTFRIFKRHRSALAKQKTNTCLIANERDVPACTTYVKKFTGVCREVQSSCMSYISVSSVKMAPRKLARFLAVLSVDASDNSPSSFSRIDVLQDLSRDPGYLFQSYTEKVPSLKRESEKRLLICFKKT